MGDEIMLMDDVTDMDVLSSDGNKIGEVEGLITKEKWIITGISVKIDSEDVKKLGKKKPFLSALVQDISREHIGGIKDKVVLDKPISSLGPYFKEHDEKKDATRILGLKLMSKDGKIIGKVLDVKVDFKKWIIPSISVKLQKDTLELMNMSSGIFSDKKLMIATGYVGDIGEDFVMLKTTTDQLKDIVDQYRND
jgi:sporulation protein YlmC with PRC-barrel domain